MTDVSRVGGEGETPVNPYSLLEAVNNSSDTAHTAWLIFIGIMVYLMIAVAGVTHRDLLLETPVALPILQVQIPITQFFQFAPVILVLFHLGVVSQLVLLARKTLEFDTSIRLLETSERRTHPLRLELHNFFFVQAVAGPHRSAVMSAFLHGMSWLTLVILPVLLLLYIQVAFLPYHSIPITWTHRIALSVDIAMLVLIGIFLMRAEASFFQAFVRHSVRHPFTVTLTAIVLGLVGLFAFFAATVPGERLEAVTDAVFGKPAPERSLRERRYEGGALGLVSLRIHEDGSLFGLFPRNLVVTDTDLVVDKDVTPGEPSLKLRGRDLRNAKLDRSDLHQADLSGANLDKASLVGADLRNVWMLCAADLNHLLLDENREAARCSTAQGANFSRARMSEARMLGADLRNAKLEETRLEGAELAYSLLSGANFTNAHLERADITGAAQVQGANFLAANLQGVDLTGADLQHAEFLSASMQGVLLSYAQLQGAALRDADLEGATLYQAKLQGADMSGARVNGADLRGARIWMTLPPQAEAGGMTDLGDLAMRALDDLEATSLQRSIERIEDVPLRRQARDKMTPLLNVPESAKWGQSADHQRWQTMTVPAPTPATGPGMGPGTGPGAVAAPSPAEAYKMRLTDYLVRLSCKSRWSNGSVATGVARRAQTQQFRGDAVAFYERLRADDCPASKSMPVKVMRDLATIVDIARSQ